MALLTNEKQLDKVLERYYNRYNKYNEKVLKELGATVKQIGKLKPSEVYRLSQQIKYSERIDDLINELADITDKSAKDIEKLFEKFAEENVEFSKVYYEAKDKPYTSYKDNAQLVQLVTAMADNTNNKMRNLSNMKSIGFVYKDEFGNVTFKGLKNTYYSLVDEAVYNVAKGAQDYQSAMRNIMNSLADSGIRIHEDKIGYKSGYSRRLDTTIRQNVLEGLRQVNADIQEQVGNDFGADGVEVSAHFPCAEDHLDIQGRQFTEKEFKEENESLDRQIGTYNCKHFIMHIVLGVDEPMYNEHRLWKWKQQSNEKFEYEGKKYTPYEATQMQRKFETAIRKQKDRQIINRASGDMDEVKKAQQKITELTNEYNNFSSSMGLQTYKNRMTVTGYRKVKAS